MDTYRAFWRVLVWSLEALQAGKFPSQDWTGRSYLEGEWEYTMRGQDLAGGFFGVLFALIGDLEYFQRTIRLP
eukprot:11873825-Karenia_brevis.AAC.1